MSELNMRIYEDGTRTIVVFNNLSADVKSVLSDIIASISGINQNNAATIPNLVPMQEEDEPMPAIPYEDYAVPPEIPTAPQSTAAADTSGIIQEENMTPDYQRAVHPRVIIKEKGFDGFLEVESYYNNNSTNMSEAERNEYCNTINQYLAVMGKADPGKLSDDTLARSVWFLYQTHYADKLEECLSSISLDSLETLMSAGRPYLEAAYRICFGQNNGQEVN